MAGCCSRPAGATGPIRSPHFVRLTWTFSPFHDMNRETLREAARAVTEMLDDMRESGWDHTPLIRSIAVGDHREGTEHPIDLQELYRLAGVARQTVLGEFSPPLTLSSAGRRGALHLLSSP